MTSLLWDRFYENKIRKIFTEKYTIIDIGGGLRIYPEKGNRYNHSNEWMVSLSKKVDYRIMDPIDKYKPDIVGDIHNMPFGDNSIDAVICIAVLEHVENPIKAIDEIKRVLKPNGSSFLFLPFLYYYHAEKGYYGDYWRFTEDSIKFLFKDFSKIEIRSVRGAFETWIHLSPLGRIGLFSKIAYFVDKILDKISSKQVSGYYVYVEK